LILMAHVHPASTQDRDGALPLLKEARRLFPFIERIFADGGYQGAATAAAVKALGSWELEIVKRSDQATGFEVLPKRWIVIACTMLPNPTSSGRRESNAMNSADTNEPVPAALG
jgi:transposase